VGGRPEAAAEDLAADTIAGPEEVHIETGKTLAVQQVGGDQPARSTAY
jgi:hypothetical protein